jgi:LCP family protein required for cell wall assembly
VVACLAAAGGLTLVRSKLAQLNVVSVGVSLAPSGAPDDPQNILIIGTDNADRLAEDDPVRHERQTGSLLADVIMVLRIDPRAQTAALLSIPRDTYVPIEPTGRKSKINSAMSGPDGPQHLIDTIKANFGLSIEHYVEVDFRGFRDLVDVLEGVPVYLTHPVRDRNTQLLIERTGCITLDAVQALAYARSRNLEYYEDGRWKKDGTADLGRISRQQDFIRRAGQRALDRGLRNPNAALGLVNAATTPSRSATSATSPTSTARSTSTTSSGSSSRPSVPATSRSATRT